MNSIFFVINIFFLCRDHVKLHGEFENPFNLKSTLSFHEHMRMTTETFNFIQNEVIAMSEFLPVRKKCLAITIWYLSNKSTCREISELFGIWINIIVGLAAQFITWPSI